MVTKKITLNELRNIIKQIIKEQEDDFKTYDVTALDGMVKIKISDYDETSYIVELISVDPNTKKESIERSSVSKDNVRLLMKSIENNILNKPNKLTRMLVVSKVKEILKNLK